MKKIIALIVALAVTLLGLVFTSGTAYAAPGDSANDPIVVSDVSEVPEGAVEDEVSTYLTDAKCDATRSWVLTVPATEDTSHQEFRYKRDIPAVAEESHPEWSVEERTRDAREVIDYVTQYHFAKFTRERTRTYTPGTPAVASIWANFAPTN